MKCLPRISLTCLFATVLALAAPATQAGDSGKPLATVNGEPITESMFHVYSEQRQRKGGPGDHDQMVKELVDIMLVTQDAEREGLDKNPAVKSQLEWQRRALLVRAAMRNYLAKHPVTDEELKKAYDDFVKHYDTTEYKARHILVGTEDQAKAVIAKLDKGADFAKLAAKESIGPSKAKGGELGWFSPSRMVKPFSQAVMKLKKGEITHQPVKTRFGWHVIKLEDTRKVEPPSLDEVKSKLKARIQAKRLDAYVKGLRKSAKISYAK